MFDKWLKLPAHYYLRITALVLLVIGIAISNVLMSIGAIWIISNWLIEAKFKEYRVRLFHAPETLLILIFLLYTLLSLLWSSDFWYGFHDLRIKLPLLAIPLALGTGKPLEKKVFWFLLYLFIGMVLFSSVFNYCRFVYFTSGEDIRQMSWFISQIRFSALVDLAFFSVVYLVMFRKLKWWLGLPALAWLLFYTLYAQVLNGYILFGLLSIYTIYFLMRTAASKTFRRFIALAASLILVGVSLYLIRVYQRYLGTDNVKYSQLELYSASGNPYFHDTTNHQTENGHFIWLYVQQEELEREWNNRSEIPYMSLDKKGQPMFGTLMRYLTSKNVPKDSAGVWSLSEDEITIIEGGCTSIEMFGGVEARLHAFLYEYDSYIRGVSDPNGSSLLQRLEHLKAARSLLADHWLFGVGAGDVEYEFQNYYETNHSLLTPENRLRSHNQFLTSWIALGLPGLLLTTLFFVVPWVRMKRTDYFLCVVLISLGISFLFEDVLETQAGVTIFSLFYALAVFRERSNLPDSPNDLNHP